TSLTSCCGGTVSRERAAPASHDPTRFRTACRALAVLRGDAASAKCARCARHALRYLDLCCEQRQRRGRLLRRSYQRQENTPRPSREGMDEAATCRLATAAASPSHDSRQLEWRNDFPLSALVCRFRLHEKRGALPRLLLLR